MKKYRYEIQRTAFHRNITGDDLPPSAAGGFVVATAYTLGGAQREARRLRGKTDCTCGCYVVVDTQAVQS